MRDTTVRGQISPCSGVPTLHLDGRPHPGIGYLTFHPEARGRYADFARAGIRLVAFNSTCNFHTYGTARPVSIGPGRFDYRDLDRRARRILQQHPDAVLLPRVYVGSPPWWDATHRDELVRYSDGSATRWFFSGALKGSVPSFSSPAWRDFRRDSLARFVRHVRQSDYGGRVLGFQLMGGETEEWFYHGTYEGYWSDYSEPHANAYREWRRGRQPFWRRGDDDGGIPRVKHRGGDDASILMESREDREVADYILFRSREVADTVIDLADIVKDASNGEALCGAFYGYVLELASHPFGLQHGGHLAFDRVVSAPSIDFLTSPTSYLDRRIGEGYSAFMCMTDSVRLHGKLWFNENDSRTHWTPKQYGCFRTVDARETRSVMRREFAHATARGAGMWWFDMRGGWYRGEDTMDEIARLGRAGHELVSRDRSSRAEVAVLVDGEGLRHFRIANPVQQRLLGSQLQLLGRIGAPFDCFSLRDLDAIGDYRLVIVLSPLELSRNDRRTLRKRLRRAGTTVVWVYAPGAIGAAPGDVASRIADVTGIRVRRLEGAHVPFVDVRPHDEPIFAGLVDPFSYGAAGEVAPVFSPDDPKATVLGTFHETTMPALAMRRFRDWTSIYSAAPSLPTPLLRAFAIDAGVHLYVDTEDVVYANASFLGLHGNDAGRRTLRFRRPVRVRDVDTDRVLADEASTLDVELPEKSTALFEITPSGGDGPG